MRDRVPLLMVFAVLAWAAGGSKSTFLPVLGAGIGLALLVALWAFHDRVRMLAVMLAISVVGFELLYVLVLGGQTGSADVEPLATLRKLVAGGVIALLRRKVLTDPSFWVLVGAAGAGVGACLVTSAAGARTLVPLGLLSGAALALGVQHLSGAAPPPSFAASGAFPLARGEEAGTSALSAVRDGPRDR